MTASPPPLDADRHALLLDFDGTFVDFAPRPELVSLRPGSLDLLRDLRDRLGGAVALVSGRRIADLDGFLRPLRLPAVGVHGQESRLDDGAIRLRPVSADVDEARRRIGREIGAGDLLTVEDKGSAIVLHYRQHPDEESRAGAIAARAVAGLPGVEALPGNNIVEIRETGISKAAAWAMLTASAAFHGRMPVFVGDDATDEDGFRAAAAAAGFGVKVGPGETLAAYRLEGPAAVHAWLRRGLIR